MAQNKMGEKAFNEHVEVALNTEVGLPSQFEDWPQEKPKLNLQMVLAFIVSSPSLFAMISRNMCCTTREFSSKYSRGVFTRFTKHHEAEKTNMGNLFDQIIGTCPAIQCIYFHTPYSIHDFINNQRRLGTRSQQYLDYGFLDSCSIHHRFCWRSP